MEGTIVEILIHRSKTINGSVRCKMIFKKNLSVEGCSGTMKNGIRMVSKDDNLALINNEGELLRELRRKR